MGDENIIYGYRAVMEAISAGRELEKIMIRKGFPNDQFQELRRAVKESGVPIQFVPGEKLNRLTAGNHQGIVAYITSIAWHKTEDLLPGLFEKGKVPFLLMLDRVTDVRNFGAIARSAECAGVDFLIVPSRGSAQIGGDAIKTSAGALNRIKVCREDNLKKTIAYLKESGIKITACHEKTDRRYYDAELAVPVCIIMGSEENGISGEYLRFCDEEFSIPMKGKTASLNVSVATGIVLFEVVKQRLKS